MAEYAHPEVLVNTEWVADHLNDPKVRIVEIERGHAALRIGATSPAPCRSTGSAT